MKGDQLETPAVGLDDDRPAKTYVERREIFYHGLAFLAAMGISVAALIWLVSAISCAAAEAPLCPTCSSEEWRLIAIVVVSAWMGGLIHAATSFATFAGNRQLMHSWLWWFYLRPPIGALLGVLVYLAARAEVFGKRPFENCSEIYYFALLAGIAGLFSKQVTDKLSDLVDSLFAPFKPPIRHDGLDYSGSVEAGAAAAGAAEAKFEEVIQRVQRLLIELGFLPKATESGAATADGILGESTRSAIAAFLSSQEITDDDRRATLGNETDPDYWAKLVQLLSEAKTKAGGSR